MVPTSAGIFYVAGEAWPARRGRRKAAGRSGRKRPSSSRVGPVPGVPQVRAASPVGLDDPARLAGRRVLVGDDGPTLTHGGMPWGAGYQAVRNLPGVIVVDPRRSAHPDIAAIYASYPHIGPVLPAVSYSPRQRAALKATIDASTAEFVVAGTLIDFARAVAPDRPVVRARYAYADAGEVKLLDLVLEFRIARGIARERARPVQVAGKAPKHISQLELLGTS